MPIVTSMVCQDMVVWKPAKLQSYKIKKALFDVELLYLTVHKSFLSTL